MIDYTTEIEINPKIMMGKPVIKGTRITVEQILEEMSAGTSMEDLLASHPGLKKESIFAALAFAADSIKGEKSFPIAV